MFENVIRLESTTSTMDVASDLLSRTPPAVAHGTAIVTDHQTHGRGRHGRRWHSEPGRDLLVSYVLNPRASILGMMPILAGLGAAKSVDDIAAAESRIKWPNDVLVNGKKVCGVIVESVSQGRDTAVVLGVGMNLTFEPSDAQDVRVPSDNLSRIANRLISRDEAFEVLSTHIKALYETLDSGVAIIDEWKARLSTIGQAVTVAYPEAHAGSCRDNVNGVAVDVDELGRLIIRTGAGHLEPVAAGEVTILGQG